MEESFAPRYDLDWEPRKHTAAALFIPLEALRERILYYIILYVKEGEQFVIIIIIIFSFFKVIYCNLHVL